MLERERIIEIVVAVAAVLVMIGVMMSIGADYTQVEGGEEVLTEDGGELFVGAVIGFILLMTVVGVVLAFALNDPEDGLEDASESDGDEQNAA